MRSHFQITVRGRGKFPIDMLRYSHCYPNGAQDVENIEYPGPVKRPVTVCIDDSTFVTAMNCIERFASFGWVGNITQETRV